MLGLIRPFKILFLDEITSDLDVVIRNDLMCYLKEETMENDSSILYATHIFDNLEDWVDDILYINHRGNMEKLNFNKEVDNINRIVLCRMKRDYNEMEELNIKEGESINNLDNLAKDQGGYSSGRLLDYNY